MPRLLRALWRASRTRGFGPLSTAVGAAAAAGGMVCQISSCEADQQPETSDTTWTPNFPREQLFRPVVPYPGWDKNWDGHGDTQEGGSTKKAQAVDTAAAPGGSPPPVTRHIILVRHGQYDEGSKEDRLRILTPLGRAQAAATGRRLAALAAAGVSVKALHVSTMVRAREPMRGRTSRAELAALWLRWMGGVLMGGGCRCAGAPSPGARA
jgi:hypothetical protein